MAKDKRVKIYPVTTFEKRWYKITRLILVLLTVYLTKIILSLPNIDGEMATFKLLWLQYSPLCLTLAVGVFGTLPIALRNAAMGTDSKGRYCKVNPDETSQLRRFMVPRTKENSSKIQLLFYYLWEAVIIVSQIIIVVLLVKNADDDFFSKAVAVICGILMGVVVYVCLTGQGFVIFKGTGRRRTQGLNPTAGMEYVPGVGAYRDTNGNYYNGKGVPIATPITVETKR